MLYFFFNSVSVFFAFIFVGVCEGVSQMHNLWCRFRPVRLLFCLWDLMVVRNPVTSKMRNSQINLSTFWNFPRQLYVLIFISMLVRSLTLLFGYEDLHRPEHCYDIGFCPTGKKSISRALLSSGLRQLCNWR